LIIRDKDKQGIGMTSKRTRKRLVEQLRHEGINNKDVLQAIIEVPRHLFVEEALRDRAYDNIPLPIGNGQTISQPYVVAKMTEAVASGPLHKVLEIGTGSGYQTAVLAQLADEVYSIERIETLYRATKQLLPELGLRNVHLRYGDGHQGWAQYAPFDGIIVTAAVSVVPETLLQQLADGGRMVIPVGPSDSQMLQLITRIGEQFQTVNLDPVRFVPFKDGVN
jgi:protein-L-isoaspartate(D-aspartate) O-methyltransferase